MPKRQKREWRGGNSVLAFGEPLVWLTGGGLLACVLMIVGLLLLVLYQGVSTFWPLAVVQVRTTDDRRQMGEVSREETFELSYGGLSSLSPATQQAARRSAEPAVSRGGGGLDLGRRTRPAFGGSVRAGPQDRAARRGNGAAGARRGRPRADRAPDAVGHGDADVHDGVGQAAGRPAAASGRQDPAGESLDRLWADCREQEDAWLAQPDLETMTAQLRDDAELAYRVWANHALSLMTNEVAVPMHAGCCGRGIMN